MTSAYIGDSVNSRLLYVCVFADDKVCVTVSMCPDINGSLCKGHPVYSMLAFCNCSSSSSLSSISCQLCHRHHYHFYHHRHCNLEQQCPILMARKLAISGENLLPPPSAQNIYFNACQRLNFWAKLD